MDNISTKIKDLRLFVQNHVRGSAIGDGVVDFFNMVGVNDQLTKILYTQDQKNPTKGMQYAVKFFNSHQKEVEAVTNLLADQLSKEVYQAAIRYRQTHDWNDAPVYSKHDQYFVKDIVPITEQEVFVDCGAFDGDTMEEFFKVCDNQFRRVICFEPMLEYYQKIEKRSDGKNVIPIRAGVYKETTILHFTADGKGSAITTKNDESTISVPVCAIDDTPECQDATFIKMDVEGSELDALIGAKETILRNRPKLAICIYHRHRDFIDIPNWIHTLVPDYKLYIRHHSFSVNETVLYAIPEEKA